jgi:hypothetical protein
LRVIIEWFHRRAQLTLLQWAWNASPAAGSSFSPQPAPSKEFPYPVAGKVRFYLLAFDGVRVCEADLAEIENGTSEATVFFELGQNVLTELRTVSGAGE